MALWKTALRAVLALCVLFVPTDNAEQWFYDRFLRLRGIGLPSNTVVLVTFPRVGSAEGAENPWSWENHGLLLETLLAAEPKLVVFVAPFDALVGNPRKPRLVSPDKDIPVFFSAAVAADGRLIPPPARLLHSTHYGFSAPFPDSDGKLRRSPLVVGSATSVALLSYERLNGFPSQRDLLAPVWVDFRGPAGTYRRFDGASLVKDPTAARKALAGRVVLVGLPAEEETKPVTTPLGQMSRLETQANVIETMLDGREIRLAPSWAAYAFSFASVIASIVLILSFPLTVSWLLLLLLAAGEVLFAFLLLSQFKFSLPVANPLLCVFAAHLLFLGQRLTQEEERRWRVERESDALREMDRFKNNFISLFSHDLKTPLARIKANLDRILAEAAHFDPRTREALLNIDRANSDLGRLISDILKVTKMETNRIEPSKDVIDLNRIAEEAAESLQYLADEKKIDLVLDLEPLFSMEGDGQLLREVVTNLVENALKYSNPSTKVVLRTREEDGRVHLTVIDQGVGIPADELPHVAAKFYRGRNVTSTHKGTGLGLYLAKYFVELHGGGLSLQSEINRGTEVSFWLPLPA